MVSGIFLYHIDKVNAVFIDQLLEVKVSEDLLGSEQLNQI